MSDLIVGDKYRLRRELGQGAMGSVWSATHELLDREVAIKFLLPSLEDAETAAARFVAEAKAAARVKHRYVVDVFDFGITEGGFYYMVQELLEGVSLADCMYNEPAWSVSDVLRFTAQCLSGLEAVHKGGVVHRDLKPENIFVIRDAEGSHPKLLDFGISKFAEGTLRKSTPRASVHPGRPKVLTALGTTLGTPAYMSPEQLCNTATMDGRADLYSLGVVMYEWLSGRVPFGDTSAPAELYRRIQERSAPSLKALRPDLEPELCEIVDRALQPDPALRFGSAAEMRAEILRVLPAQPLAYSIVQRAPKVDATSIPAPAPVPLWAVHAARAEDEDDERVSIPGLARARVRGWAIGGLAAVTCVGLLAVASFTSTDAPAVRARPPLRQELVANEGLVLPTGNAELPAEAPAEPSAVEPAAVEPGTSSIASGREPSEPDAVEDALPAALPSAEPKVVAAAAPPEDVPPPKAIASAPPPAASEPKAVSAAPPPAVVAHPAIAAGGGAATRPAAPPARPIERVSRPVQATTRSAVPAGKAPASAPPRPENKNDKVVRTLDF